MPSRYWRLTHRVMIVMMQNNGIVGVRNNPEHIHLNGIDCPDG